MCAVNRSGNSTGSRTGPVKTTGLLIASVKWKKGLRCLLNQCQNGEVKNSGFNCGMILDSRVAGGDTDDEGLSDLTAFPYIALVFYEGK